MLSHVMLPCSLLYKTISGLTRAVRTKRRREIERAPLVVSVGNIEVGGNGKTPFAIHVVERLAARGYRSVYVSRGFKSEAGSLDVVTVLVPESEAVPRAVRPGLRILRPGFRRLARAVGDEGAMVAMRCPEVPLVFSRDRRHAVEVACEVFDPTHVILDDSFQTWSVARDVDIVLLDSAHPLGNGRVVPAGSLREDPDALRRADAIGFNGLERAEHLDALSDWVRRTVERDIPVFGVIRGLSFIDAGTGGTRECPAGRSAALSSIARPSRFERSLVENGLDLCLSLRYPDHHKFDPHDIRCIDTHLANRGIKHLITTEKDWVKLRDVGVPVVMPVLARLELRVVGEDPIPYEKPQGEPAALSLDA